MAELSKVLSSNYGTFPLITALFVFEKQRGDPLFKKRADLVKISREKTLRKNETKIIKKWKQKWKQKSKQKVKQKLNQNKN